MTREIDVMTARQQAIEAARAMLAGKLSFIEGARQISDLRWFVDLPEFDPDVICFVVIYSETDTLPFGDVRQRWQPAALEKLRPEIERSEHWARETGWAACQSLIARFSGNAQSPVSPGRD
jgi:hypothetical protein